MSSRTLVGSNETRGGATLDEVADALGVTRERARQIEVEALKKAHKWCLKHDIKFEDMVAEPANDIITWSNW